MSETKYEVIARLRLEAAGALGAAAAVSRRIGALGTAIRGTSTLAGGLTRTLVGLGAGYIGLNAIVGTFTRLTAGAISFQNQMEQTRIGLASVLSAVEGTTFEQGVARAGQVFRELSDDAIRSTATTQELFTIFQGIVGPIEAAGFGLDRVRHITNSTVAAASALGVDLGQAQRDISLMVRGAAGMDVRLFSMLRSTGAIAEDTQKWNRTLTTQQRVERLTAALDRFAPAAEAYGRSFAGVTSSFKDIAQQFTSRLTAPVFARFASWLGRINDRLIANRETIGGYLDHLGQRAADQFDRVAARVERAYTWILEHWDEIVAKWERVVQRFHELRPMLERMARIAAIISVGRQVVGGGLQLAGGAGNTLFSAGSALLGGGGAGVGAAGAAGAEGASGAMSMLGAAAGPLAAVLAIVAGWVVIAVEHWQTLTEIFQALMPVLRPMIDDFMAIASALWDILRPILKAISISLGVWLLGAFMVLVVVLRAVLAVVRLVAEAFAWMMRKLEEYVIDPLIGWILGVFRSIAQFLGRNIGVQSGLTKTQRRPRGASEAPGQAPAPSTAPTEGAPNVRPQVHNDFRGSRITVHQEFREADPDRVWFQMVDGLNAQASRRMQSGFAPALTR